jgi:hypothetical protein
VEEPHVSAVLLNVLLTVLIVFTLLTLAELV